MTLLHTSTAFASIRAVLGNESLGTIVALSRLPRRAHRDSIPGDIKGARYVFFCAPSVHVGSQWRDLPMKYNVAGGYPTLLHTHQAQPARGHYLVHKGNGKH